MALWVLIIGVLMNLIALPLAGKRVLWLYRLITSGQPDPSRVTGVTKRLGNAIKGQLVEVFGQQKLLKWSVPGMAHSFVMYAFLILGTVYVEAYGVLFSRDPKWSLWILNSWGPLGFLQDLIGVLCLVGLGIFTWIRLKNAPEKLGRKSRFKGSHLGGAWLVLFMIFNVIWTLFLFRGASSALGNLGYGKSAFVSYGIGRLLHGLPHGALEALEGVGLLLHIGVMLVFLIIVLNSKHLHIFIAPLNVLFKREPVALGAARPLMSAGKPVTLDDIEEMDEDTKLGVGSIEDFSWKGLLDMATCTECGRCQSQCPAWNTEKPLSPKMLIMNLRDHAFATAPYLLTDGEPQGVSDVVRAEQERPLVGPTEGEAWHPTGGGIIDPDVLWSCVTCGACVEQCPVDIEHVDHIIDMRRHQVLVESSFPAELGGLFKGMENRGNPWNMNPKARLEWAQGLDFEVPVVGEDVESLDEVEWLFWVGCAGAYEDRAKKTTRAVAELLHLAEVKFAVLGNGETCTGDSARRAGNEFLFQQLAMENVETFKETKAKKVVSTCAHCFNTLKNEYKQFGIELEVVHHTQLLNRLVREKKLVPVGPAQPATRSITYHDPCYLGRHNQVYSPPRELLTVLPGAEFTEMPRNSERSFCCGAGGARMWMEETIGTRINETRTAEAVETGADQIAVGCPFCRVMLDDGLTAAQASGSARAEVEVLDVAQLLLASVKGEEASTKKKSSASASAAAPAAGAAVAATATEVESTESTSLFDAAPAEEAPSEAASEAASESATDSFAGGSLFDAAPVEEAAAAEPTTEPTSEPTSESTSAAAEDPFAGGSLFDAAPVDVAAEEPAATAPAAEPAAQSEQPAEDAFAGGSLFDVVEDTPAAEPEVAAEPAAQTSTESAEPAVAEPAAEAFGSGSLFDIPATEPEPSPAPEAVVEAGPEVVEAEPESADESTGSPAAAAPVIATGTDLPDDVSLFDIGAADAAPAETPAETPAEKPAEPVDPAADATADAVADAGADAGAEEDPTDSPAPAAAAPPASGEQHTPRTDADLDGLTSLFDL